jgi:hypothetical protein
VDGAERARVDRASGGDGAFSAIRMGGATIEAIVAPVRRAASNQVLALNRGTIAIEPPVTKGGAQR